MNIVCATCTLRPLRPSDAESLALHGNDREIWRNLRDRFPHPYRKIDADEYIRMVALRPRLTSFGIEADGAVVGGVSLRPGEDIERCVAEIGYWLGRAYWGRGIMSDAVRAATQYAFTELALERVFAVPFAHNEASCRVLEKAGYAREALMRRSAIKEGKVLDQYLYAVLRVD
jgi:[ribosomal protein S5]-alanine N-acetyltransferase